MKVSEFIKQYNDLKNGELKENLVACRVVTKYVPYTEKMAICNKVANLTTHKKIKFNDIEKEIISFDSPNRYLLFQTQLIKAYTDLEFDDDATVAVKEFEELDKFGLNDLIIAAIPEREYVNFNTILNMYLDDISMNENNLIQYIDGKLDSMKIVIDTLSDGIMSVMDNPEVKAFINSLSEDK